jgi:hypothetical protein
MISDFYLSILGSSAVVADSLDKMKRKIALLGVICFCFLNIITDNNLCLIMLKPWHVLSEAKKTANGG